MSENCTDCGYYECVCLVSEIFGDVLSDGATFTEASPGDRA